MICVISVIDHPCFTLQISIEFRNAAGKLGPHPFPAGLTDCIDAIVHIANHKSKFNIGKIVLLGASGGGNLILASALKLKKDNNHIVDGVYACCPYISGRTEPGTNPPLISLVENPFFVDPKFMSVVIKLYNLNNPDEKDPLAWPVRSCRAMNLLDVPKSSAPLSIPTDARYSGRAQRFPTNQDCAG